MNDDNWELSEPVVLFIYQRPEKTVRVLNKIAEVKPPRLYIVADGPKKSDPENTEAVRKTRDAIKVDWDCQVMKNYADSNMGLKKRTISGLDWVFKNEERVIFLEDDILMDADGFRFLEEMLNQYENDDRIMHITGYNRVGTWKSDIQDYHFSYYPAVWGSAIYRRAWEKYDPDMKLWESDRIRKRVRDVLADDNQFDERKDTYKQAISGEVDSWSIPFGFVTLINSGLSVVPSRNLVTNIGMGEKATHTGGGSKSYADRYEMEFPIQENEFVAVDRGYDKKVHSLKSSNSILDQLRRVPEIYQEEGAVSLINRIADKAA
jgi:hypothetical protein